MLCYAVVLGTTALLAASPRAPGRTPGPLDRGVVAMRLDDRRVVVSWRLLADDPPGLRFRVERSPSGLPHPGPDAFDRTTFLIDDAAQAGVAYRYTVRAEGDGVPALAASGTAEVRADAPIRPYLAIPLRTMPVHTPNDASAADLDGDGAIDIVLKQEERPRDNSQRGPTGRSHLEAYRLDGRFLWRIDLGPNIREGAHYTPFLVFDLDGDGRAEVACRTADGTIDGTGRILGDATADDRDERGTVLSDPEYLTVFDGATGRSLDSAPYIPPRGDVKGWGDDYGNRSDRFLAAVAYLDGERPSLVFCRGHYTRTVLAAWDFRDGKLAPRWVFDSDFTETGRAYSGQGNHNLAVADVDDDGRDEIMYGACAIDDDGAGLYSTGLGHGDAIHVGDLDPARPGLEALGIHERPKHPNGLEFRDARTGEVLWGKPSPDVGRGLAADIDPRHDGEECWAAGEGLDSLYTCRGEPIGPKPRSCNFAIWWDNGPLRELMDGARILKWDHETGRETVLLDVARFGCRSNNGTKATPCLVADIIGDAREEAVYRSEDGRELRVFIAPGPATRRVTRWHDPVYRLSVAWQNVGYNLPTRMSVPDSP